jgi:PAS domain S-box-containing protein
VRASILCVEDNEGSAVALRALLEPLRQHVDIVATGEDALRKLLHEDYAVVLMDVKLPGIDGYETAALMRGIKRTRMTPIIFLTGVHRESSEVLRGYDKGAVDYLVKPYDPDILRSKVAVFVELYRSRMQIEALTRLEAQRVIAEAERARFVEKEAERRLFEAVLRQMPGGIAVAHVPGGEIVLSNRRLREIFGADDGMESARAWLNDDASAREYETPLSRCVRTGDAIDEEEVSYRRADGVRRLALGASPVLDDTQHLVAVVGTVLDVTARHEAQQEREQLIRALEKSNETLETFAYVASHDLKAPLRGISSLSNWIEEALGDSGDPQIKESLGLMRDRVTRMTALVDGILRYARAGGPDAEREELSISVLLAETIDLLQPPATVRIDIDVAVEPIRVRTTKVVLQQLLLNLIGNAIKHADRADAQVNVGCVLEGDALHIMVRDNGPGIAVEAQARIWDIFYSGARARAADSTGIGLAVVKRILDARGGRAWVESEVGRGSTFHVHWPL